MRTRSLPTRRGARRPALSAAACVIGLLCYLLLPGLHAFHADGAAGSCGAGDVSHEQGPRQPARHGEPAHDSSTCGVCQVFFATQTGTDLAPPTAICTIGQEFIEPVAPRVERIVVATAAPDRMLRGPPLLPPVS